MKLESGKEIEEFSLDLALALEREFEIDEHVWDYREYVPRNVDVTIISDFIQKFIGDRL